MVKPNPYRVLIVEDVTLFHRMYGSIFQRMPPPGVTLCFARDGNEGLLQLHQEPSVDLILLDINMPGMSGMEFLHRVRSAEAFSAIPVIIVSTEDHQADILRGLREGATGYLTKPFTSDQLLDIAKKVLPGQSQQAQL